MKLQVWLCMTVFFLLGACSEVPTAQWSIPACQNISGLTTVGWSPDLGGTVKTTKVAPGFGVINTMGLVTLKAPNTLLAEYGELG